MDGDVATDVLIAWKTPLVQAHLKALFDGLMAMHGGNGGYNVSTLLSPIYGGSNLSRLVQAYHPKELVPFLLHAVMRSAPGGFSTNIGGEDYRWSPRIDALGMLVRVTEQEESDYGLVLLPQFGGRWLMKGGEPGEAASVKALRGWWKEHYKEYDAPSPELPEEEVAPGSGGMREDGMFFGQ